MTKDLESELGKASRRSLTRKSLISFSTTWRLSSRKGIPPNQQHLIFAGKQLKDGHALSDHDFQKGSTLRIGKAIFNCVD